MINVNELSKEDCLSIYRDLESKYGKRETYPYEDRLMNLARDRYLKLCEGA